MPNLYPYFEAPSITEPPGKDPPEYKKSYLFNFEKGDFVRDGSGRVVVANGQQAWEQWCQKALMTARYAYLAYSKDYGTEAESFRNFHSEVMQAEIERDFTEALLVSPRTLAVKDFNFTREGEELYVSCTAVPVIGDPAKLEVAVYG